MTNALHFVIPTPQFHEHHHAIIDAPIEAVWRQLNAMRWADLRMTRPLLALRGLGLRSPLGTSWMSSFHPPAILNARPPFELGFAMVSTPWRPVPKQRTIPTLEELRAFREPGWLKMGMEWQLRPLDGGRTLLETTTSCAATDPGAYRAFRAYWTLIRAGSGLIRRDMIHAIRRRVREAEQWAARDENTTRRTSS